MPRREHRRVVLRLYPEFGPDKKIIDWLDHHDGGLRENVVSQRLIGLLVEAIGEYSDAAPGKDQASIGKEENDDKTETVGKAVETEKDVGDIPAASSLSRGLFK